MQHQTIKAVVLDLGQVLIRLDFSQVMEALGFPPNQSVGEWLKNMDAWKSYDSFERGLISEADFFRAIPKVKAVWNTVLKEEIPHGSGILKALHDSVRLFALTNTNESHLKFAMDNYPILSEFEQIFSSHLVGARKPEEKIYRHVEEHSGLSGHELLFIDDRIENVKGAKNIGWKAEHCKQSPKDLIAILERYRLFPKSKLST